jgi:phage shock protein C
MKRLYKSEKDTIFCGICGGVAEYFSVDSTLIRIGAVVLAIMTGGVGFAFGYTISCLIIPNKYGKSCAKMLKRGIEEEVKDEAN